MNYVVEDLTKKATGDMLEALKLSVYVAPDASSANAIALKALTTVFVDVLGSIVAQLPKEAQQNFVLQIMTAITQDTFASAQRWGTLLSDPEKKANLFSSLPHEWLKG